MKRALLGVVLLASSAWAEAKNELIFKNSSDWAIHNLYFAKSKENDWGPDQLGAKSNDIIAPGASFTLTSIPPGKYDMKIVDEDGDECVVAGVKVVESEKVELTNELLVGCQKATAEQSEE